MVTATGAVAVPRRRDRRPLLRHAVEHLLDWAEPIVKRVCREVWREFRPTGFELEDLFQEGRIEVYLGARRIMAARDPEAMTATIVRRRAIKAVHSLSDRYPKLQLHQPTDGETDEAEPESDQLTAA
jgi:DNA-directed RNA polymerase specialized sigma24 family protein